MTLSDIYGEMGLYDAGEPLARKALGIREQALGPSHPDVAASLDNLANIWRKQGRLAEAEALARRSLEVREAVLGPNDLDVAQSLNDLAVICWNQGRLADAEPLLERSLKIREARLGPEHPDVATTLYNLGVIALRKTPTSLPSASTRSLAGSSPTRTRGPRRGKAARRNSPPAHSGRSGPKPLS